MDLEPYFDIPQSLGKPQAGILLTKFNNNIEKRGGVLTRGGQSTYYNPKFKFHGEKSEGKNLQEDHDNSDTLDEDCLRSTDNNNNI